ncbi:MAG: energy transducer TonB [Sphingomonas sp.]|nr:energy transducer TonB [Sphingomonas sp.]
MSAVMAIHLLLLFMLLHLSGRIVVPDPQSVLRTFDVTQPLRTPVPPPATQSVKAKPKEKEGGSAPKNVKSEATPVVAPKPRIQLQQPNPMVVAEVPRQGTNPTQGASSAAGPGTGAGGIGTGTGSGLGGNGLGGGGDGGAVSRAQLLTPSLRSRDFPRELRRPLERGRSPFIIFTVLPNGRVANCRIYQSSGDQRLDQFTCALVTARFVYRPAFNRRGEPVASQNAYRQAE